VTAVNVAVATTLVAAGCSIVPDRLRAVRSPPHPSRDLSRQGW
jgi:hypothetical protein